MADLRSDQPADEGQEHWLSLHLYYHQNLDRAVLGFVYPLVVSLARERQLGAFFFVRFGLGGPHIRLRIRVRRESREHLLLVLEQAADQFLGLEPSTQSMSPEIIRRSNEYILAADPHEVDASIYPDNFFRVVAFCPETGRYGGVSRVQVSLDFFTLSSVAALDFLVVHRGTTRSAQLAQAFRLLLQQALGFAQDETELTDLLRYGVDSWGKMMPTIVEKADRVAQAQLSIFADLWRRSVADIRSLCARDGFSPEASGLLVIGARRLSQTLRAADRVDRAQIGGSHLHMTATRLGLSNAEEVYLSRLLTTTISEIHDGRVEVLQSLASLESDVVTSPAGVLDDLLAAGLSILAEMSI